MCVWGVVWGVPPKEADSLITSCLLPFIPTPECDTNTSWINLKIINQYIYILQFKQLQCPTWVGCENSVAWTFHENIRREKNAAPTATFGAATTTTPSPTCATSTIDPPNFYDLNLAYPGPYWRNSQWHTCAFSINFYDQCQSAPKVK